MKSLKLIASILVTSLLVGCGTPPAIQEKADLTILQNDNQFNYVLSGFLEEYSEARLNFALIFSVDVESIGIDEWKKRIDENDEQWENLKFYGEMLEEYLAVEEAWIRTAYAQSEIIDTTYGEPDFESGSNLSVDVEDEILMGDDGFDSSFHAEVLRIRDDSEHKQILKNLIKKLGARDGQEAQKWLEEANSAYNEILAQDAADYEKLKKLSEKVRNSAIFAGVAGLTVGGLYVSGASLLSASGTVGISQLATAAGFSLGSIDFLLTSGEHGAYLLDNKEGQEFFAKQQDEMDKQFGKAKFVLSLYNLAQMKLPTAKDFNVDDIPDFIDNVKFLTGLTEKINTPLTEEQIDVLKEYEANKNSILQEMLPSGAYYIDGKIVNLTTGILPDNSKIEELPEADLVEGPTIESLRAGHYVTSYKIDDMLTNQSGGGTIVFDVNEDSTATGTVDFAHSGSVTQNFNGISVTTNTSSSFNASINGNFNVDMQRLEMNGTFTGSTSSETQGQVMNQNNNGNISLTGVFSKGEFVGTMTITSDIGSSGIANWKASAQ